MRALTEEEINARLLYRDALMLVVDKPAGIAVHVTGNDKIALEASFKYLQFGLPKPPVLAHRLDRGTSGCLVLGRHRQATMKLGKLFETGKIEKTYLALVVGTPAEPEGILDQSILKSGQGSNWRMTLDPSGQRAETHYRLLKTNGQISLLELSPKTGRTHQIRLHCAGMGCPVIGDPFYGPKEGDFATMPMMLHAQRVVIPFKPSKPPIEVTAPLPPHMRPLVDNL